MKLMVAIPTLDFIHWNFAKSLVGLTQRLDKLDIDYDICFKGGTLVYLGRDELAAEAINSHYTHVLWLDADMVFNPDVFEKLLADDKEVVSGVYHSRHAPYQSNMFLDIRAPIRVTNYPEEVFEIDGCGFGMILVETKVLHEIYRKHGYCFQPEVGLGEDLSFCKRAKLAGYKIWCDPNVKAGHIGHVTIFPDMGNKEGAEHERVATAENEDRRGRF